MPRRYLCYVLEEMRTCWKSRNFSLLKSLIEEAQVMGNRMEAAIGEKHDYQYWHKRVKKEKEEHRRLLKIGNKLRKKAGEKEVEEEDRRW